MTWVKTGDYSRESGLEVEKSNNIRTALIWLGVFVGIGVIFGFGDATAGWLDIDLGGHDGLLDFMAWLIPFAFAGVYASLIVLFVGIAKDVQAIREKIDQNL